MCDGNEVYCVSVFAFFLPRETRFFVAAGMSISNAQVRFMDDLARGCPSGSCSLCFPDELGDAGPWGRWWWKRRLYRDSSDGGGAMFAEDLLGVMEKSGWGGLGLEGGWFVEK